MSQFEVFFITLLIAFLMVLATPKDYEPGWECKEEL